jgi:hypothetical protein
MLLLNEKLLPQQILVPDILKSNKAKIQNSNKAHQRI